MSKVTGTKSVPAKRSRKFVPRTKNTDETVPIELSESASANGAKHLDLKHKETSAHRKYLTTYRHYRFSPHREEVRRVRELYGMVDANDAKNYVSKFDDCGYHAWFLRNSETGQVILASSKCKLRFCPVCAETKSHIVKNNLQEWMERVKDPKFLTLTLRHNNAPLKHQVRTLYDGFRALRRHKIIKDNWDGGVWFCQVTFSKKTQTWHPHLHIILDAKFIHKSKLVNAWYKVTKSSCIVDIRMIKNPDKTSAYVARYASRPCSLNSIAKAHWEELFYAMKNIRLCGKFGTGRKVMFRFVKPEDNGEFEKIGSFTMVYNFRETNETARQIWEAYRDGLELEEGVCTDEVLTPPPPPTGKSPPEKIIAQLYLDFYTAEKEV